jgi:hypothetical protein
MNRNDLVPVYVAMKKRMMEFSDAINTVMKLGGRNEEWVENEWKNFFQREYDIMVENGTVPSDKEVQECNEWWAAQEDIGKVERMVLMTPLINVKTFIDDEEKKKK